MAKDPYQILGVSKTASQDEIKNAYRSLAKKLHPDLNPGNKASEAKFKDISAAYELIGTAEMRAKFDRGETPEQMEEAAKQAYSRSRQGPSYYESQQDGGRYSFHSGGDNDFFEELFKSAGRGRRGAGASMDFPGEDQLFQMEVDFKDAARGAQREIQLPTGKKLEVKIPAGVETGSRLRFKGQGGPGIGRGAAGDLYVEIRVRPLAGFARNGNDIEVEAPISFIESILGSEIPIPTLDGKVSLKIPAGSSTGSKLRLKGKGIAGKNPGDQIVVIKVAMPKTPDPELQAAVRAWGDKFSYDPRARS